MDRRRFLLCSVPVAATLSGCLDRDGSDAPGATATGTTAGAGRGDDRERTETTRSTDQHLVLVNASGEEHTVRVTVSGADDDVFDRTVSLAADARRQFLLDVDEPGTYTVSVSVDGGETGTWSVSFEDYDLEAGSDVFVEVSGESSNVYWEE